MKTVQSIPSAAARERGALSRVAGRPRDDPARLLVLRQSEASLFSIPRGLKEPGALEELRLQEDVRAERPGGEERRPVQAPGDRLDRALDVLTAGKRLHVRDRSLDTVAPGGGNLSAVLTYVLIGLAPVAVAAKLVEKRTPKFWDAVLLVAIVAPLVATVYAMWRLWDEWIGWRELTLFLVPLPPHRARDDGRLPPARHARELPRRDRPSRRCCSAWAR